jgi:hypothetical protein
LRLSNYRPGRREHEEFLEIEVMGLAILRRDIGAIGDLDRIAMRLDLRRANQVGALADVPPFGDLRESSDLVALLTVGIVCGLDEPEGISIWRSADVHPHTTPRTVTIIHELSRGD